jgi:hypothetical protein
MLGHDACLIINTADVFVLIQTCIAFTAIAAKDALSIQHCLSMWRMGDKANYKHGDVNAECLGPHSFATDASHTCTGAP